MDKEKSGYYQSGDEITLYINHPQSEGPHHDEATIYSLHVCEDEYIIGYYTSYSHMSGGVIHLPIGFFKDMSTEEICQYIYTKYTISEEELRLTHNELAQLIKTDRKRYMEKNR